MATVLVGLLEGGLFLSAQIAALRMMGVAGVWLILGVEAVLLGVFWLFLAALPADAPVGPDDWAGAALLAFLINAVGAVVLTVRARRS